jgi:hypothetical protein
MLKACSKIITSVVIANLLVDPTLVASLAIFPLHALPSNSRTTVFDAQALAAQPAISHKVIPGTAEVGGYPLRAHVRELQQNNHHAPAGSSELVRRGVNRILRRFDLLELDELEYRLHWSAIIEGFFALDVGFVAYLLTGHVSALVAGAATTFLAIHLADLFITKSAWKVLWNTLTATGVLALAAYPIRHYGLTPEALLAAATIFFFAHYTVNGLLHGIASWLRSTAPEIQRTLALWIIPRPWQSMVRHFNDNFREPKKPTNLPLEGPVREHFYERLKLLRSEAIVKHARDWVLVTSFEAGLSQLYDLFVLLNLCLTRATQSEKLFLRALTSEVREYLLPSLEIGEVHITRLSHRVVATVKRLNRDEIRFEAQLPPGIAPRDVIPAAIIAYPKEVWVRTQILTTSEARLGEPLNAIAVYIGKKEFLRGLISEVIMAAVKTKGYSGAAGVHRLLTDIVNQKVNEMQNVYDYHGLFLIKNLLSDSPGEFETEGPVSEKQQANKAEIVSLLREALKRQLEEHKLKMLSPKAILQRLLGVGMLHVLGTVGGLLLIGLSYLPSSLGPFMPASYRHNEHPTRASA